MTGLIGTGPRRRAARLFYDHVTAVKSSLMTLKRRSSPGLIRAGSDCDRRSIETQRGGLGFLRPEILRIAL